MQTNTKFLNKDKINYQKQKNILLGLNTPYFICYNITRIFASSNLEIKENEKMSDLLGFNQRESYALARFYAMEYMARNGSESQIFIYMDCKIIKYLSLNKTLFIPGMTLIETTAKELVL